MLSLLNAQNFESPWKAASIQCPSTLCSLRLTTCMGMEVVLTDVWPAEAKQACT